MVVQILYEDGSFIDPEIFELRPILRVIMVLLLTHKRRKICSAMLEIVNTVNQPLTHTINFDPTPERTVLMSHGDAVARFLLAHFDLMTAHTQPSKANNITLSIPEVRLYAK